MHIRWLGHSAFLLTGESKRVVVDPYRQPPEGASIRFDYRPIDVDADLVLVSHEHFDHDAADAVGGAPEVLRARAGTFDSAIGEVVGVASEHDPSAGTQRGANVIFRFALDGVRCCHMGDFGQRELRAEQREAIGPIDILFIPVGGGPTIGGREAAVVVDELHPGLVVPMHFATAAVDFIAGPEEFLSAVSGAVRRPDASEIALDEFAGSREGTAIVVLAPDRT